jgi:hypothetical protein
VSREDQDSFDPASLPESVPDFLSASGDQPSVIDSELLLDGRWVTGEIRYFGVTRRLVDILNALESGYLTLHKGTLRDRSGSCLDFDLMQIARNSILLAYAHQGSASRIHPGEVIRKHRRLVTVIMPGCQVSGYFHLALGVDPSVVTASVSNRFVALTDVTITALDSNTPTRFESLTLLNTAHAEAYVWSDEAKSAPSHHINAEAAVVDEPTVPSDSSIV